MVVEVANARRTKAPKKAQQGSRAVKLGRSLALRGHGDYTYDKPGPFGKAGRWIGGALGQHFAGPGGGKLGAKLGSYLHYIGKIFGSGDYATSNLGVGSNTLVNSSQIPAFVAGKSEVRIQHREYLGDVISSATPGAFKITDYAIQPGLALSFPWLANVVGTSFQQHRINGMVFEYRSMSADSLTSTNTALGTVIMATDYDSTDQRFTSKQQMENTEFGVSCKPSVNIIHAIECARSQTSVSEQYIRYQAPPVNADIRLYDLGRFSIATQGLQGASVNCGELWVSYDISFLKPIQLESLTNGSAAHFTLESGAASGTTPLKVLEEKYNSTGVAIQDSSHNIVWPADIPLGSCWLLNWAYALSADSATAEPPDVTTIGGMKVVNILFGASFSVECPTPNPGPANILHLTAYLRYDGPADPVTLPTAVFSNFAFPGQTLSVGELIVTQINPQMLAAYASV